MRKILGRQKARAALGFSPVTLIMAAVPIRMVSQNRVQFSAGNRCGLQPVTCLLDCIFSQAGIAQDEWQPAGDGRRERPAHRGFFLAALSRTESGSSHEVLASRRMGIDNSLTVDGNSSSPLHLLRGGRGRKGCTPLCSY